MGNAPLPSPPRPSPDKIIWSITTNHKIWGTRLNVLTVEGGDGSNGGDSNSGGSNSGGGGTAATDTGSPAAPAASNATDDVTATASTGKESIETVDGAAAAAAAATTNSSKSKSPITNKMVPFDIESPSLPLPPAPKLSIQHPETLQEQHQEHQEHQEQQQYLDEPYPIPRLLRQHSSDLTQDEYDKKLTEFHGLLSNWKGGIARVLVLVWAMLVVLTFVAGYFIPNFWSSGLFESPIYLPIACVICLGPLVVFSLIQTNQNRRLLYGVNELFEDWLMRYKIHVRFYRVANVAGHYAMTRNGLRRQRYGTTTTTTTATATSSTPAQSTSLPPPPPPDGTPPPAAGTTRHHGGRHGGRREKYRDMSGSYCYVLTMAVVSEREALSLLAATAAAADDGTVGMSVGGGGDADGVGNSFHGSSVGGIGGIGDDDEDANGDGFRL